jgi:hypothetical protein
VLIVPIFLFNKDTFTNTIKYLITMATDIIPQDLIIYRRILTTALATITNEMIANNAKLAFRTEFTYVEKKDRPAMYATQALGLYLFKVYVIDKSKSVIGETVYLYNNYYLKYIETSLHKVEKQAIQDWFTNGSKALYNVMFQEHMERVNNNLKLIDQLKAEGATMEVVKARVDQADKDLISKREADILAMMTQR